jgi:hypothetical protein
MNRGLGAGGGGTAATGGLDAGLDTSSTKITPEQRSRLRDQVARDRIRAVRGPTELGIAVPASVPLRDLSGSMGSILPTYKTYKFYVAGRDFVVVEPETRQIVSVVRLDATPRGPKEQ